VSRLRPPAPLRSRVLSPPVRGSDAVSPALGGYAAGPLGPWPPSAPARRLQRPRILSATRSLPALRRRQTMASAFGRVEEQ
jgi:hypothetical protein